MKNRSIGLVALFLVALPVCRPTWSMEHAFEITGRYNAVIETEITASLMLKADSSAQYSVHWLDGEGSKVLDKFSADGRWTTQGNTLTLTIPYQGGMAKIVYEVSPCLSYESFGSPGCSPGLHVVTSELPSNHTWELWKAELLKLVNVPSNNPLQRSVIHKVLGRGRGHAVVEQVMCARVLEPLAGGR